MTKQISPLHDGLKLRTFDLLVLLAIDLATQPSCDRGYQSYCYKNGAAPLKASACGERERCVRVYVLMGEKGSEVCFRGKRVCLKSLFNIKCGT